MHYIVPQRLVEAQDTILNQHRISIIGETMCTCHRTQVAKGRNNMTGRGAYSNPNKKIAASSPSTGVGRLEVKPTATRVKVAQMIATST